MDLLSLIIPSAVAFIIAILSGLGIGSGGLFLIWLSSVVGVDPLTARGMNLLFFVFSASAALVINIKDKRILPKDLILPTIPALLGALVGLRIGGAMNAELLRRIFGIILVFSGARAFVGKRNARKKSKSLATKEKNVI